METQDTLYLNQFYRHPALSGKLNPNLKMAPFSDQVVHYVSEWLEQKERGDFVLCRGYETLHRLAPRYFPPLETLLKGRR